MLVINELQVEFKKEKLKGNCYFCWHGENG